MGVTPVAHWIENLKWIFKQIYLINHQELIYLNMYQKSRLELHYLYKPHLSHWRGTLGPLLWETQSKSIQCPAKIIWLRSLYMSTQRTEIIVYGTTWSMPPISFHVQLQCTPTSILQCYNYNEWLKKNLLICPWKPYHFDRIESYFL